MKYFQHDLNSREDDKIWELVDRHQMSGYGIWWVILEELYKAEENGFQVKATQTYLKRLGKELGLTDYRTLIRVLDTMAELSLINPQLWAEHIIFSPAVVARGDNYMQKKVQARERKRKEREAKKELAEKYAEQLQQERLKQYEEDLSRRGVTRDTSNVTEESQGVSRTNTDADTNSTPDPDSDSKPEFKENTPLPPKRGNRSKRSEKRVDPDQRDFEFQKLYNQLKAQYGLDNWQECMSLNPERLKHLDRFYEDCDRQNVAWDKLLCVAMLGVKNDNFYGGKIRCEFEKLFRERRYQAFYEAGLACKPEIGRDIQQSIVEEMKRLKLTAALPHEWRSRTGAAIVSELSPTVSQEYLDYLRSQPTPKEVSA